jgi:hypothetical protein
VPSPGGGGGHHWRSRKSGSEVDDTVLKFRTFYGKTVEEVETENPESSIVVISLRDSGEGST